MNIRLAAIVLLLGAAGTAGAQVNIPNPATPGGSFQTAVRMVATSEVMVDRFIQRWLRSHYPGWDADPHEFQDLGNERYAVVYIKHSEHPGRRVYFRVMQSFADPDAGDTSPF